MFGRFKNDYLENLIQLLNRPQKEEYITESKDAIEMFYITVAQ